MRSDHGPVLYSWKISAPLDHARQASEFRIRENSPPWQRQPCAKLREPVPCIANNFDRMYITVRT